MSAQRFANATWAVQKSASWTQLLVCAQANNAAGDAGASVAGGLGVVEAAAAQVVLARVHNDGAADDGVGAAEGDEAVGHGGLDDAVLARLDVAQIACSSRRTVGEDRRRLGMSIQLKAKVM